MPTLADIYEEHAQECLRAAAKTENPKHRDMLLRLAGAWREDAEALKRGEKLQPASAPRKARAFGRGAEGAPGPAPIQLRVTRFEWGSVVGRIVRAAGVAKDH